METRSIGSLDVSLVGLGCNNFGMRIDDEASARVVHAAIDAGITFFDTADIYGDTKSEAFLGRALSGRRDAVVIATKFGMRVDASRHGAGPEYVRQAADDSLRRLGTDRIDLYQLHQPDPTVPIADTLGALDDLVRAGKVREIGCSNFSAEQLREAQAAATGNAASFVSVQNEYSLLNREAERAVLPECEAARPGLSAVFPAGERIADRQVRPGYPAPEGSRLSQSWAASRFLSDERLATVDALAAWARSRGRTMLELAMSWLASRQTVASVIAGATSPEQVRANAVGGQLAPVRDRSRRDRHDPPKPLISAAPTTKMPSMRNKLVSRLGNSLSHRGGRGARIARRETREYREYLSVEQRGPRRRGMQASPAAMQTGLCATRLRAVALAMTLAVAWGAASLFAQHETAADIEDGGRVFGNTCANCHGPDGDQIAGIDLGRGQFRRPMSDQDLIQIIRSGIPGTPMPASNFSEEQAAHVVAYLQIGRRLEAERIGGRRRRAGEGAV